MQTKLTLRMDEQLVEQAKSVAKTQGKSVSQMVSDYFVVLGASAQPALTRNTKNLPVTQSLRGIMANTDATKNVSRDDYHDYLADKYQ